jgi:hypothetical protein
MPIFYVFLIVVVIGVLLALANKYLAPPVMDAVVLRILNIAVIVGLVLWLLSLTGVFDWMLAARVPRMR